jgi:hypothetical protein
MLTDTERAEIERHNAEARQWFEKIGEGDWTPQDAVGLRAVEAVDALLAHVQEQGREKVRAVEAMRRQGIEAAQTAEAERDALQREVGELREALRWIADGDRPDDLEAWTSGKSWRVELARQTLEARTVRGGIDAQTSNVPCSDRAYKPLRPIAVSDDPPRTEIAQWFIVDDEGRRVSIPPPTYSHVFTPSPPEDGREQ